MEELCSVLLPQKDYLSCYLTVSQNIQGKLAVLTQNKIKASSCYVFPKGLIHTVRTAWDLSFPSQEEGSPHVSEVLHCPSHQARTESRCVCISAVFPVAQFLLLFFWPSLTNGNCVDCSSRVIMFHLPLLGPGKSQGFHNVFKHAGSNLLSISSLNCKRSLSNLVLQVSDFEITACPEF